MFDLKKADEQIKAVSPPGGLRGIRESPYLVPKIFSKTKSPFTRRGQHSKGENNVYADSSIIYGHAIKHADMV